MTQKYACIAFRKKYIRKLKRNDLIINQYQLQHSSKMYYMFCQCVLMPILIVSIRFSFVNINIVKMLSLFGCNRAPNRFSRNFRNLRFQPEPLYPKYFLTQQNPISICGCRSLFRIYRKQVIHGRFIPAERLHKKVEQLRLLDNIWIYSTAFVQTNV